MFDSVIYSQTQDCEVKFDLFLPPAEVLAARPGPLAALVSFHPGGCVSGNRNDDTFPHWLKEPCLEKGIVFISADYRLLVPANGFDELEDVKTLFKYLTSSEFSERYLPAENPLDASRIAVVGFSGGGYIANLAAVHAVPKPKAVWLCWAQGCDELNPKYVEQVTEEMRLPIKYDEARAVELLTQPQKMISESYTIFNKDIPLLEDAENRLSLIPYWAKTGETLDWITGEKGLAKKLRGLKTDEERIAVLPEKIRPLFPQLSVEQYPPTVLVHGDQDTVVDYVDSVKMHQALKDAGKETEFYTLDGEPHALPDLGIISDPTREKLMKAFDFVASRLSQ
ncbi:alpha/beta-hydrolase [Cystobasidium minutum MCA 4210]|uniref:alpha/beta-hydrolase n=1 Tax=Cystobasidium minutum MCA 4210 TaxID=1397322 RepID=UPI0034CE51EC|eukprot:jgi/Rhomi1/174119/fgenesh1_kg.7_\